MNTSLLFRPAVRSAETHRARFEVNTLLCTALGALFLGTGIAKIVAADFVIETFRGFELAPSLLVAIGFVELAAAVLTIIPTTRLLGTGTLATLMLGALGYHVMRGEALMSILPASVFLAAVASLLIEVSLRVAEPVTERVRSN